VAPVFADVYGQARQAGRLYDGVAFGDAVGWSMSGHDRVSMRGIRGRGRQGHALRPDPPKEALLLDDDSEEDRAMRPDELERRLRERLDALGPAPRAELLHVLMLPDFERAGRIGEPSCSSHRGC
jgi:hypothetical protein